MEFVVTRVSQWDDRKAPCDWAVSRTCVVEERRNVDDPSKALIFARDPENVRWWYGAGQNHRVEGGCIVRDIDAHLWIINIDSIDELTDFVNRQGECVLKPKSKATAGYHEIEIYDCDREDHGHL